MTDLSRTSKAFEDLTLSQEAMALVQQQPLGDQQGEILRLFTLQQIKQRLFWESDVSTSESTLDRRTVEDEIGVDDVNRALVDTLDPLRCQKRIFLTDLVGSKGTIEGVLRAFESRERWEHENEPMIFGAEDVEPYRLHMIKVFDKIFRQARSRDQEAVGILKRLLTDFGKVPGADYQAWLGRRMAESMPNDVMCMMAKDAIRQNPGQFDELVERFLNGENLAQVLSLPDA